MSGPPTQTGSQSTAEQAQEKAGELAGQAQERAQQAAGQVQDRVRQQLDQRSTQAAEQIHTQAADLRSVGETLREQGKDGPARIAEQLAGYAERAGRYLQERDTQAMLADAEDLGRRQPWAVAAGGAAVGFVASRLLKASSRRRYEGRTTVPRPNGVYAGGGGAGGGSIGLSGGTGTGGRREVPPTSRPAQRSGTLPGSPVTPTGV